MTIRAVTAAAALLLVSAGLVLASTISIRVGSFYFEDATQGDGRIVANVGDRLRFVVEDNGNGTPHSVEVDELGIHSGSLAKGDVYTTPQLSRPGSFLLYCRLHIKRGHKTTLVVVGSTQTPAPTRAPTPAPTKAPAKAPNPTPTRTPSAPATPPSSPAPQTSAGQLPSDTAGSSTRPDAGGITSGGPANPDAGEISAPNDDQRGAIRADDMTWLRSVVVGLLSMPVLAALALLAIHRSRRRGLAASRQHDPWVGLAPPRDEPFAPESRRGSLVGSSVNPRTR
jgi:plastocyanin